MSELPNLDFDLIFITNRHYQTLEQTLNIGIPESKIYIASTTIFDEYNQKNPNGSIKFALASIFTQRIQTQKTLDEQVATLEDNFFLTSKDGFRVGTLQLIAKEIQNRNVEGEIAELGVFQGNFSKHLNQLFSDRTLNLFDTFEGFDSKDETTDLQRNLIVDQTLTSTKFLRDTSTDLVMSKMKHPERVKIYKGYFPATIPSEEKQFALVSIDVDLYAPALEGLKYFYPRLSDGGFIMLHDYNESLFSKSIHQAVEEFEQKFGRVAKIPIADQHGSLIITK